MKNSSLLFLLMVILTSCGRNFQPIAIGPEGTIVVFADSSTVNLTLPSLNQSLGKKITTLPQPQPLFDLEFHRAYQFLDLKNRAYILFLASLSDSGATSRLVRTMLSKEALAKVQSGEQHILPVRNLWNDKQLSIFIVADSLKNLNKLIEENAKDLIYLFNDQTLKRTEYFMFRTHTQPELSKRMYDKLGFTVAFQHDYVIVKDTLNPNFFYMKRAQAEIDRWMWIYWWNEPNPDFSEPLKFMQIRDSLTKIYIQADDSLNSYVEVARDSKGQPMYFEQKEVDFKGRYGIESRGLWRLNDFSMGGPFINYTFYNDSLKQMFMIDGSVLAPRFERKRDFVRELEIIAKTISWKAPKSE